ncbi:winged helix-turn-helix transcriptional regulator [Ktedonobacteria bacterium brp13]|nr:winged helix-turn-helix transcriptional regulator [Ktedonobacteria bacterium brp13]
MIYTQHILLRLSEIFILLSSNTLSATVIQPDREEHARMSNKLHTLESGETIPRYTQLRDQIATAISSGQLAPGARLPSERALSEQYKCSRLTIRQALGVWAWLVPSKIIVKTA